MSKKRLALCLALFGTGAAQAYTLVDNEETGTSLEFIGSARLRWSSEGTKETDYTDNGRVTKHYVNRPVANNGSRFGFRLNQRLYEDFYTLGRVEWRFRGRDNGGVRTSSQHDFDHLYARQLYAGVGHKKFGELTYGNQTVITDEVKQTDLPNTLSLSDGLLVSGSRRSLQYVYEGLDGLKLGAFYGGASPRGNNGLSLENHRKDVLGAGAIYKYQINDDNELVLATGATRERFKGSNYDDASPTDFRETVYAFDTAYTYDDTTFGLDLERSVTKDENGAGNKLTKKEIRTLIYHKLTSDWRLYGMYAYKTEEDIRIRTEGNRIDKDKTHEYMVGTEYHIIPKTLRVFLEWKTATTKSFRNGEKREKLRDNQTVIGLRLYW